MRIVSIVPSLTEAIAWTAPEALVGCTDWCTHPAWLAESGVVRVRGTKNPDVDAIVALRPDLVVANEEENRLPDLVALQEAGIDVMVTTIRSVASALSELDRLMRVCGWSRPAWLDEASAVWVAPEQVSRERRRAVIPVWRRPWMAVGPDTYAGDLLARLGVDNALDPLAGPRDRESVDPALRYPHFSPADLPEIDLVVLPDEPYRFSSHDGPEAFDGLPCALVNGRLLTWYGPAMVAAPEQLLVQLRAPL